MALDGGYGTPEPQSHRNEHQDSSANAPSAYFVHFLLFGRCNLVWALQGSVYSFRSFKINRTNYMKAFLAGSRFVKPCCLLVPHAERLSLQRPSQRGRARAEGSQVSDKAALPACMSRSLGLSCVQLNCKPKTPSKTLGLSLYAHLIPPTPCLQQSLNPVILPGCSRMVLALF